LDVKFGKGFQKDANGDVELVVPGSADVHHRRVGIPKRRRFGGRQPAQPQPQYEDHRRPSQKSCIATHFYEKLVVELEVAGSKGFMSVCVCERERERERERACRRSNVDKETEAEERTGFKCLLARPVHSN